MAEIVPLLQKSENVAAAKFADDHYKRHGKTAAVIITAEATGLGYSVKVQCPHCRKTKDITDISTW